MGTAKKGNATENQTTAGQAAQKKAVVKPLEEMDLLDDFLFGSVVGYPEIGERFVGLLLKTIYGREFGRLSVTAQKVFYGAGTERHGARLDVYLEQEEDGGLATVYDIEPDRREADVCALPRRVRFYHGKIAARSLNSGADYDTLKNVIVIMILPYDPFGRGRMAYTVRNRCVEEPEMEYDDGASTLFLYTKGTVGIPSEPLRQLLRYMEDSTYGNAVNAELRGLHRMVETVKRDPEVVGMRIKLVEDVVRLAEENERMAEDYERETARLKEENIRVAEEAQKKLEEGQKKLEEERRKAEAFAEKLRLAEETIRRLSGSPQGT